MENYTIENAGKQRTKVAGSQEDSRGQTKVEIFCYRQPHVPQAWNGHNMDRM